MTRPAQTDLVTVDETLGIAAPGATGGATRAAGERDPVVEDHEHPGRGSTC